MLRIELGGVPIYFRASHSSMEGAQNTDWHQGIEERVQARNGGNTHPDDRSQGPRLNSAEADSETTKEAPLRDSMYYMAWTFTRRRLAIASRIRAENLRRRRDFGHASRSGRLDEWSTATLDSGDGSHHVHRLDLRSSGAARASEGGPCADVARHRSSQEEKRSDRCQ